MNRLSIFQIAEFAGAAVSSGDGKVSIDRISTDSRTVADTTLSHEFELASAMGVTDEELQRCNAVAYEAKFG
jgi:hypothetical protein